MADLQTDVRYIKGIGEARAKALSKLGIATLQDLIGYFPRRYEDRTMTRTIREPRDTSHKITMRAVIYTRLRFWVRAELMTNRFCRPMGATYARPMVRPWR